MNKVAFIWHLNLNASLLPRQKIITYATKWIPAMLETSKVCQNISSMGEDWLILQKIAPALVTKIKEDDRIGVLNGTFSHGLFAGFRDLQGAQVTYPGLNMSAIRLLFQNVRQAQLTLGDFVHKSFFGSKLAGAGIIPEFDLTSNEVALIKEFWDFSVLKQTANRLAGETAKGRLCGLIGVLSPESSDSLPCLITNDTHYNAFHGFYLGKVAPQALVQAIEEQESGQPQVIVMDLDGLFLNRTNDDPQLDPGFKAWQVFQQALAQSRLEIMTLPNLLVEAQAGILRSQGDYFADPRDYAKWQVPYYDEQVIAQALSWKTTNDLYQRFLVLSNMTSDRYSALTKEPKIVISEFGTDQRKVRFNQVGLLHTDFYVREQALLNRTTIAKIIEQIDSILKGTCSDEQRIFLMALDSALNGLALELAKTQALKLTY